jgi:hypothetical protein
VHVNRVLDGLAGCDDVGAICVAVYEQLLLSQAESVEEQRSATSTAATAGDERLRASGVWMVKREGDRSGQRVGVRRIRDGKGPGVASPTLKDALPTPPARGMDRCRALVDLGRLDTKEGEEPEREEVK